MKKILLPCLAALHVAASLATAAPNVIVVLTDDLGYGDLYCLHQNTRDNGAGGGIAGDGVINGTEEAFIYTPELDRMAAEGAKLTRHYTSAPVCAPARGSLLQGRDQGHANIRNNSFDKVISDNHTLGTVMDQAGYYTACVGKWGVGGGSAPYGGHPTDRGFDYFYGYMEHLDGHQHYPGNGGTVFEGKTAITTGLTNAYTTDLWTAKAKQIIQDRANNFPGTPFFLYLAYDAPHAQLQVPTQAYPADSGEDGGLTWPLNTNSGTNDTWLHPDYDPNPPHNSGLSNAAARHATMVRRLDTCMGDILETLRDLEIDDNTLVIFTSDNGTHNESGSGGSVAHDPRNFDSYGELEGIKRDHWEGGIRMPTFAWWPTEIGDNNQATPGVNSTRPSAFWDWMPTIVDAAGLIPPAWTSGVSLLPELTGTGTQQDKGYLYFEYNFGGSTPNYTDFPNHGGDSRGQMQTIFLDDGGIRYKGIRTGISNHSNDFQIYDVDTDQDEGSNLAASHTALQQRMKDKVLQVRIDGDYSRSYLTSENAPPATPAAIVNGLDYKSYTGTWNWVPETATLTPAATGDSTNLDLTKRTTDDDIALEFTGYLSVPTDGTYTFQMTTDSTVGTNTSGGMLWIHDAHIIDDDFNHTGATKSGTMRLKAGLHPIRVLYKHATGTHDINLKYSGPGIALQDVPDGALFRDGIPSPEPVANPDSTSTSEATAVTIPVLANDNDDGLPTALSIAAVGTTHLGTALISGDDIIYTPDPATFGMDQFTYTITDGEFFAQSIVTVSITGTTTILSSDFNAHGSADGAASFSGISWTTNGVTAPAATIALSAGATVQTSGAAANADRLAVARNIDTAGPWSIDLPFTATTDLTASKVIFDYQFISGGGGNQSGAHPDSGIVTVTLLDGTGTSTLSSITLPALGTSNAASNLGTGIVADFPNIALTNSSDYLLRFHVDSNAASGNNFALDNLMLEGTASTPTITSFTATPDLINGSGTVTLDWATSFAGRLVISDGTSDIAIYTTTTDGQATLDAGSLVVPISATTTFVIRVTIPEDGSGNTTGSVDTTEVILPLAVDDFGLDTGSGHIFMTISNVVPGSEYQLFKSPDLQTFTPLGSPITADFSGILTLSDPEPFDSGTHPQLFYQVRGWP